MEGVQQEKLLASICFHSGPNAQRRALRRDKSVGYSAPSHRTEVKRTTGTRTHASRSSITQAVVAFTEHVTEHPQIAFHHLYSLLNVRSLHSVTFP
jgi:hypothetical protein